MNPSVLRDLVNRAVPKMQHYYAGLGVRGVLLFSWAKIWGTQPVCRVTVPGVRHPVAVRIGTTDVSVLRQVLRECHYDVPLPSPPRRILDAGANIGLAAVFFANKFPESEIVAIEPDESNFLLLRENARPYSNIYPIKGALWGEDGELLLIDPGDGHHGFQTVDRRCSPVLSRGHVTSFTVETVMECMNWVRVDLLKLDIEGAEKEVLEACDSWIARVGACMVELHDSIKPGCVTAFERATADFAGRTTRGESLIAWRTSWV
jgi:FkbM family methyltransferase